MIIPDVALVRRPCPGAEPGRGDKFKFIDNSSLLRISIVLCSGVAVGDDMGLGIELEIPICCSNFLAYALREASSFCKFFKRSSISSTERFWLTVTMFLIVLALAPNLNVLRVSSALYTAGLQVMTSAVLVFPPKDS